MTEPEDFTVAQVWSLSVADVLMEAGRFFHLMSNYLCDAHDAISWRGHLHSEEGSGTTMDGE